MVLALNLKVILDYSTDKNLIPKFITSFKLVLRVEKNINMWKTVLFWRKCQKKI